MRRLTRARCEREEYCDNIGDRRAFASFAECTQELGRIASSAPLSAACPRGIDEALLEDCLSEVRKEVCGNPRHTAHRIEQCKDDKLCVP